MAPAASSEYSPVCNESSVTGVVTSRRYPLGPVTLNRAGVPVGSPDAEISRLATVRGPDGSPMVTAAVSVSPQVQAAMSR